MVDARHSAQGPTQGVHVPYNWEYANAAARTGASGFSASDVGKLALQQDDNSLWLLTATTPTWQSVGSMGSPAAHAASHQHGGTDEIGTGTPAANAIPKADSGGKLAAGWIPAVALPEMHVVADSTARLALSVQEGDEAKQTDDGSHWIYDGSAWHEYPDTQLGPHSFGGSNHTADTLANVNSKISDATLIDTGDARLSDARTPTAHGSTHTNGTDNVPDLVGDSGSGGVHGLVPAPAAGDAAASKFLKADGSWSSLGIASDVLEVFVWDETATPLSGAYTSWASLLTALQASTATFKKVYFAQDLFGTLTIPTGTHNIGGGYLLLENLPNFSDFYLLFAAGCQFNTSNPLVEIRHYGTGYGHIDFDPGTAPNILLGEDHQLHFYGNCELHNIDTGGTNEAIHADGYAYVFLHDKVSMLDSAGGPFTGVDAATGWLELHLFDAAFVGSDTLSDNSGDSDIYVYSERVVLSHDQAGLTVSSVLTEYQRRPHALYIMGATNSTVDIPVSPTWQTVPLSVVETDDPNFTFSGGVVTLDSAEGAGEYEIVYDVTSVFNVTSSRSTVQSRLVLNGSLVNGTVRQSYVRTNAVGDGTSSTARAIVSLVVGDSLAVETTLVIGTAGVRILGDGAALSIRRIR